LRTGCFTFLGLTQRDYFSLAVFIFYLIEKRYAANDGIPERQAAFLGAVIVVAIVKKRALLLWEQRKGGEQLLI
jgi:hypothetical protein